MKAKAAASVKEAIARVAARAAAPVKEEPPKLWGWDL